MARIVGRRPIELKISDQLNGYIPVYNSSSRLWGTISKNDFITGSAITSGSNIFVGDQIISGSLTVVQGITGSLFGTASYADNAWALGGNTFTGGDSSRILGTFSNHDLSVFVSGSKVATFTTLGSLVLTSGSVDPYEDSKLAVYAGVTTSHNLIKATSNIDGYSQIIIQNLNTGSSASSNIVAIADNGSTLLNRINVGINSSTFTGSVGDANDAYLYSTGNDLHIGNASNFPVQLFAGGTNVDTNRKLQLNPNNLHQMTGSLDVSGSVVAHSFTGSLQGTSSYAAQALTASNANTASSADDFTVRGTLTAQTIIAQTITSSTEFITGSTQFGSLLTDTHQFTGSVSITGSLEVNGRNYINDSSSFESRITTNSGSFALFSGSYINESSSFAGRITTNSASFTTFSGSYVNESSSFSDRITTNSASFTTFSGSYINESSSFAGRITTDSASLASFSGSYVNESSSFASRITTNSSSFATFSGSHVIESASFDSRINNISSSFGLFSGSFNTGSFTGSFIGSLTGTASYAAQALTASNANTASSADDFTVRGTLTAQKIIAQTITSSTEFITGSTKFGSLLTNTHQFTGSVLMTGSVNIIGILNATDNANINGTLTAGGFQFVRQFDVVPNFFGGTLAVGRQSVPNDGYGLDVSGSALISGSVFSTKGFTGSFSGSLYNLQNSVLGRIPFYSSSQVLVDSIARQLDNGSGSYSIAINQDNITTAAPEALYVYQPSTTSYNVISGKGNLNNYLQLNIQNTNTGVSASSDVVATANNGNETTNYIDMGINSEGFTGLVGDANDAYLYSTGNDLHIGNASNFPIQFFAGGLDNNANNKFQLNPNNSHQMTGSLDVSGSIVARSFTGLFTGSLQGTSSVAVSASYATSASYAVTASLAINANNAANASTASYVLNAISASYAATASNAPSYLPLAGGTMTGDIYAAGRSFTFQDLLLGAGTTFGKITTDGTKYISIMPNYNVESARFWPNGNVTIQDAGTYVDNGFRLDVSGSGRFTDGLTITGSLQAISGITGSLFGTASYAVQALTSSFATTASYILNAVSASYAATASSANDFLVRGTLTAQTIIAQTITSSIDFVTGSTRFGTTTDNTHQFTGSVSVSGSLGINGVDYAATSASFDTRILNNSGSIAQLSGSYLASSASFDTRILNNSGSVAQLSGSYLASSASFDTRITNNSASVAQLSGSYLASSASFDTRINVISSSYATTGSNIFKGNQTITGSFAVSGSTIQVGNNTLLGNTTLTGSITVSGPLRLDPTIDPGLISNTSSFLFTSASKTDTGFDLYYRQGLNNVKFKWFEGVLNTGILYGGILTYSASNFYVSSGSGIIVNHNATTGSEISPTITYVNWAATTHSISNPTAQNTYVFIDASGNLQQQNVFFTPEQYHDALPIGRISHYGATGSLVTGVGNNMLTSYDLPQQLGEFTRAFGPLKMSGFTITPQVGNLSLNIGSGTAYNLGGYYQNSPDLPSTYNSNTYVTSSIIRIHRSGSGFLFDSNGGAYYTTVNPLVYDDGDGTLATVGSGNWSIQRVFVNPITGRSHVYYGQSTYTTYLNAVQSVSVDDFVESEVTKNAYVFAGYLVMQGGAANDDLSVGGTTNAIIQAGLFRNSVGGSGGATTAVSDLNDLSDVNISAPSNGQALIYSTGTWINGTPISSSYAATASFVNGISNGTASYANTASFALTASYLLGQSPTSSYALTASYVENAQTASYVLNAQTASYVQTAQTASYVQTAQTASYVLNAISASYAATASSADDFIVRGTLTAQTIVAQTITSSIEFITGSTRNGSLLTNTHQFTGSVLMTGSLTVNGDITGSSVTVSGGETGSITSPSAGVLTILAGQASTRLNFGGNTNLFPSLLRNASTISFRNGSNDGFTGFTALSANFTGTSDSSIQTAGGYTQTGTNLNTLVGPLSASNATFSGSVTSTRGFTGSLQGTATTASYVLQAQSASYWSGSVINAATASYVLQAQSASYWSGSIINATSASYALTASYAANVPETASYALNANTASFALTASYISGSVSGFPFSGSALITGSLIVSQSFVDFTKATYVTGSFTGSFSGTATSASYSSYALFAGNAPGTTVTMSQAVAATTWSFTHNLNTRNPLLQVYDSTNTQIIPLDIVGTDPNQATIYFDVAESGYAVASNGGGLTVNGSTSRLDQTSAAVTWSFQHNLVTKYPNFVIYDSTDNVVIPAGIHAVDNMSAEIYFAFPSTGVAIANFSGISGSVNVATASYAINATTASYAYNFNVANQLTIDQTLTDYHTVPSSIVGSNNMFTRVTGSYSSAFFKYSVTKGSNSRAGEVIAAWAGGTLQFTDNSTLDVGDTSGVVATAIIAASSVQFNLTTADSGWTLKTLGTFM